MGNYRGRLDIIADILQVASHDAKKTQIMYQANLSYKVLQKYLRQTLTASLLHYSDEKKCYQLTEKGRDFIDSYTKYARSSRHVEEYLNDVESKRRLLEDLCSHK